MTGEIRFEDGAAYERMMGQWSRIAGTVFLDWLSPPAAWQWADIGCGNGAFTELLCTRCAPAKVQGIDPSPGQIEFARKRSGVGAAEFQLGVATELPFASDAFDAAVMALVIFFVPDPIKGVAEMRRVVRPGGMVAAYAWDIPGGGFPLEPIQAEMRAFGIEPLRPPRAEVSSLDGLLGLWTAAGLQAISTREIAVRRTFADFDDFWASSLSGSLRDPVAAMSTTDVEILKSRLREKLPADADGRITYGARANAVTGQVPGGSGSA